MDGERIIWCMDRLHKIHFAERKATWRDERPLEGFSWFGRRLTRKQTTSRPDIVWPDMWKHLSDAAKSRANKKPKLDNARQSRGSIFIELEDEEFTHIIKMLAESWKFRCQQHCFVKCQWIAGEKFAAVLGKARPNLCCRCRWNYEKYDRTGNTNITSLQKE